MKRRSPYGEDPPGVDQNELRSVMAAWGRYQAAFATETFRFFFDLDLTTTQFRALAVVRRSGRLSGRDLAGRLGVTPGTVVPLCDRLEERRYLRRVPDKDDRRLTWLELTPSGEELFRRLWLAGGKMVMQAITRFDPADRRTLKRLFDQIADYLETESGVAHKKASSRGRRRVATDENPAPGNASDKDQ